MARQNTKQQPQEQITGFQLGGLVPLSAVGHVMAALYEHGAENLQIAPFLQNVSVQAPIRRRVSDTSGIAGLLAPPAESQAPLSFAARTQALIEIVSTAPAEGLKKNEILAALKERGIGPSLLEGSTLQGLLDQKVLRRAGFGMYSLGKNADRKSAEPPASNDAQVSAQDQPKLTKRDAILLILKEYGPEGVKRNEIQKKLSAHGFRNGHFDALPLQQLIDSGHAIKVGSAMYAATNAAPIAKPPAKPTASSAVEGEGKKTVASHILAFLLESAPQPRTAKEITEKLNKDSVGTKLSVGVELSKMFQKNLIARPTKGTYALLPE